MLTNINYFQVPNKYKHIKIILQIIYLYFCKFLEPYTEYQMYIVAKGEKNKMKITSENSDTINQYTDVDAPGPPVIINATCVPGTGGTSIFVQWTTPEHYYKSIDEYIISVSKGSNDIKKYTILLPKENHNTSVCDLYFIN